MPFDWREHEQEPLENRFERGKRGFPQLRGADAWSRLLTSIAQINEVQADSETSDRHETLMSKFREFLNAIDSAEPPDKSENVSSAQPVVFVSHQRSDIGQAERVAYLAWGAGVDYWLDIHDPTLLLANRLIRPNDARYPFIIAAIIEMALLNSSHLLAVHTINSLASKWVPYELGRVRDRHIQSDNAGGWFHPNLLPRQCGDYVHLCRIARGGEATVTRWLNMWAAGRTASSWNHGPTTPLP